MATAKTNTPKFRLRCTTRLTLLAIAIVSSSLPASSQRSTAKAGYFPYCYAGDIFTRTLFAVDDNKSEITLTYTEPKHGKVESLVGEIVPEYTVRSLKERAPHHLRPSELMHGERYSVCYCVFSKKVNGEKTITNSIFLIDGVPNLQQSYSIYKVF